MLELNKETKTPIYQQIYEQLKDQIISNTLKAHERLPATRTLAQDYHISRNSVLNAYQQLESEGFISSKIGSGFYVEELPENNLQNEKDAVILNSENEEKTYRYDFRYGSIEPNFYQTKAFRKALKEALNELEEKTILNDLEPQGLFSFRKRIAEHLREVRGVDCDPKQIVITGGHRYSLNLLAEFFDHKDYDVAIEDPGHRDVRNVFEKASYKIHPIPLDDNGIRIDQIGKLSHTLVCLTPSHQFPMGMILPIARRFELLKWAKENDGYIIEDDYDSELRYRERPIPALYSLDLHERVIYLGSFSKSLSPDLRVSYIVFPAGISLPLQSFHSGTSLLIQMTLSNYLKSGEYRKRINRMRNSLRKKHNMIIDFFHENYQDKIKIYGIGGGSHFVLEIPNKKKDLQKIFHEEDVAVYPISDLYFDRKTGHENMIMIGYSGIPLKQLDEYLDHLKTAIDLLM